MTIHKVLVTAVQRRSGRDAYSASPRVAAGHGPRRRHSLPTGSLLLTVAVNDVDAKDRISQPNTPASGSPKNRSTPRTAAACNHEETEVYK